MPKKLILLLLIFAIPILLPSHVFAARTIGSANLNGSSSVNVPPSTSISAVINVTTSAIGGATWQSTSWTLNAATTCVNHTNYSVAGSYSESFSITAPASVGSYNVDFIAYSNNLCSSGGSTTYILTNGIIVSTPTPTPPPGVTPSITPTPNPNTTAIPTSVPGSGSSTSTTIYYPTVTLVRNGLNFSGIAEVENGTINTVEYSFDSGSSWNAAKPTDGSFNEKEEDYFFILGSGLSTGSHTVLVRAKTQAQVYTQSSNYASVTFTVTPPEINLDNFLKNPTSDPNPLISGSLKSTYGSISRVEVSRDNGKTWNPASFSQNRFKIRLVNLEDGNYEIVARAFDSSGNMGISDIATLVIDTIPPIIGGNMISIGPQILLPNKEGVIRSVVGAEITITTSMKGGVTEAKTVSEKNSFELVPISGTNLWSTKIKYDSAGIYQLTVVASDGAKNVTQRNINLMVVEEGGTVRKKETGESLPGIEVSIYFFDNIGRDWVHWDAQSFGQSNPHITNDLGVYSFLVPPGKYYLEANSLAYKTSRSQILEFNETSIINYDLNLSTSPTLRFKLPIFGDIILSLSIFQPPDSIQVKSRPVREVNKIDSLYLNTDFPNLTLTKTDGNPIDSSNITGGYLLTFVSAWSASSHEQIPILNEIQKGFKGDKIYVVFLQDSPSSVSTYMQRGKYNFVALSDKSGESTNKISITTLPQHFFINQKGITVNAVNAVLSKEELLNKLDSLE